MNSGLKVTENNLSGQEQTASAKKEKTNIALVKRSTVLKETILDAGELQRGTQLIQIPNGYPTHITVLCLQHVYINNILTLLSMLIAQKIIIKSNSKS